MFIYFNCLLFKSISLRPLLHFINLLPFFPLCPFLSLLPISLLSFLSSPFHPIPSSPSFLSIPPFLARLIPAQPLLSFLFLYLFIPLLFLLPLHFFLALHSFLFLLPITPFHPISPSHPFIPIPPSIMTIRFDKYY